MFTARYELERYTVWSGRQKPMFLPESAHLQREGQELNVDRIYYPEFANAAPKLNGVTAVTVLSAKFTSRSVQLRWVKTRLQHVMSFP